MDDFEFVRSSAGSVHIVVPVAVEPPEVLGYITEEQKDVWRLVMQPTKVRCGRVFSRAAGQACRTGTFNDAALCEACRRTLKTEDEIIAAFSHEQEPEDIFEAP